ncbi:propanediol utilization protein, partial [Escherichia coli]|nr:propanediol utilization protein [Escherichia coli]
DQVMVKGIGQKLAAAGVQDADYYPEGMHHNERQNWRNYLETERKNISDGLVIELPVKKKTSEQSEDELKPRVECRPDGVYWVTPKVDKQSGEIIRPCEWIGDRMRTVGIGHDGCDGYLIIELEPEGMEKIIYEAMPRNEIGLPSGWSRLRGRGVAVTTSQKLLNKLAEYLQREGERTQWEVTSTAGWHCGAYVMPDGEIIGVPERPVAFCGGSAAIKG